MHYNSVYLQANALPVLVYLAYLELFLPCGLIHTLCYPKKMLLLAKFLFWRMKFRTHIFLLSVLLQIGQKARTSLRMGWLWLTISNSWHFIICMLMPIVPKLLCYFFLIGVWLYYFKINTVHNKTKQPCATWSHPQKHTAWNNERFYDIKMTIWSIGCMEHEHFQNSLKCYQIP